VCWLPQTTLKVPRSIGANLGSAGQPRKASIDDGCYPAGPFIEQPHSRITDGCGNQPCASGNPRLLIARLALQPLIAASEWPGLPLGTRTAALLGASTPYGWKNGRPPGWWDANPFSLSDPSCGLCSGAPLLSWTSPATVPCWTPS
jgi:hypothetical protein